MPSTDLIASEPTTEARPTAEQLQQWIIDFMAREMKVDSTDIAVDVEFSQYDFDSALALSMVGGLEDLLERKLSPTLAYNYPTIEQLAAHLAEGN